MTRKNLVGRCGLYCGVCEIYRAYKDSKKLQEELAKKHNCLPEEVRCLPMARPHKHIERQTECISKTQE